jgi:hypothetical protein
MNYKELLLTNPSVPHSYTADKGKIFKISHTHTVTATTQNTLQHVKWIRLAFKQDHNSYTKLYSRDVTGMLTVQ